MARLSDRLVVQLADTKIVVIDDQTGSEHVIEDYPELMRTIFAAIGEPVALGEGIVIPPECIPSLSFWLGYFHAHITGGIS